MKCRHCKIELEDTFLNLGFAPPSNAYLESADLNKAEKYFPLKVMVCKSCWLVQTEDYNEAEELFDAEYAYLSSTSSSWLEHARKYSQHIIELLKLDSNSHVIELASNDGYLLKNFLTADIPCLGIEPTDSTADVAEQQGIPVIREFFGESLAVKLAEEGKQADLVIGNNVYAHVPDINDFTLGIKKVLKQSGTITLEFPHLLNLLNERQFDTIYHEHFSYLSLYTVSKIFQFHGLRIFDVERLPTHGGSLRIYGCHINDSRLTSSTVAEILDDEGKSGLQDITTYQGFQEKVDDIKNNLVSFLIEQKKLGKKVVAYGAAAKGNTLLNYAGVKPDLLPAVFDAAPSKQWKFMPGSHIPIFPPASLKDHHPDFLLILPWNIAEEIKSLGLVGESTAIVTAVPTLKFL